ncbi:hypothetical protein AB3N60_11205 [Leptospira sp. WS39.C2]
MIKLKQLLIIFFLITNCSSYKFSENKETNKKNIIWISTTIDSEKDENYLHPKDSLNLSLKLVNQLDSADDKNEFRVLYHKDQRKSDSLIDIKITKLYSNTEIPLKSVLPTILTAGFFLAFGGDSHEDTFFAKVDISFFDENNIKKGSKSTNFLHKKPYSIWSYIFPFVDYRFMNLSEYNPSSSLVFSKFISENILTLTKNEN